MEILFTEITNTTGPINKKILKDGTKKAAANLKFGSGRTMRMPFEDMASYLESLNAQPDKALVLGINSLDEYKIQIKGRENVEKGIISRTKEYFDYCNSDTVGLMYFDVDGGSAHGDWTEDEVGEFIEKLETVISGCLIGKEGTDRTTLCRFVKDSSSAGLISPAGEKLGSGIHIYFPVRNPSTKLLELIYKWAWLNGFKSHLIDKAGGLHIRTVIDKAVGSPERLVFESDCTVHPESGIGVVARECSYVAGGVLDSELAIAVLEDIVGKTFETESRKYIEALRKTPEVVKAIAEYEKKSISDLVDKGVSKIAAKKAVRNRRNGIILSSDFLIMDDMTEISVQEILTNREEWSETGGFRPPMEPEYGSGKAKLFVNDTNVILNSFAHGGQIFELKFDFQGILEWIKDVNETELEELFPEFVAQAELSKAQSARVFKEVAKKIGATKKDVEDDVKEIREEIHEENVATACSLGDIDVEGLETQVGDDANHIQIASAVLCNYPNHKVFGEDLYTFEKTIWKQNSTGSIKSLIGYNYGHCGLCKTGSHYNQLMRLVLEIVENRVTEWKTTPGFPCSNQFYEVKVEDKVIAGGDYKKEFGCRFKMGFEPDFEMKTPLWDQVIQNVVNVDCMQRIFGLSLAGMLSSWCQEVGVFKGPGGVGKGTVTKVLSAMLPPGRVTNVSVQEMNIRKQVWQLKDSAINLIPEITTKKGNIIDLTGFKAVTGGDFINGEQKYVDSYPFVSSTPHIISMNQWPNISAFGTEVSRRMQNTIVEFVHNHDERIDRMDEKIIQYELPGVLAWAIKGVEKWFENGNEDKHSRELFAKWARSVDSVASFVDEGCRIGPKFKVTRQGLYDSYKVFCKDASLEIESRNYFYDVIRDKFEDCRMKDNWYFKGLELVI